MSKIVLVDDDEVMLELLTTLLNMVGHQVIVPAIDKNVIETISQDPPDVILVDVCLQSIFGERIDGLDLLDQIHQHDELRDAKVIMSSGMDFREESLAKGADDFLHKPYMPETLMAKIGKQ